MRAGKNLRMYVERSMIFIQHGAGGEGRGQRWGREGRGKGKRRVRVARRGVVGFFIGKKRGGGDELRLLFLDFGGNLAARLVQYILTPFLGGG